ncbi:MAG TPA: class I tRNA ligase family protein [Candidatus Angelobacter sp.]
MSSLQLIVAPPPTPNGDLHVGHMSGPYLAADIYRRRVLQQGKRAVYMVSSDDHQSYVDTTANRLGLTPEALIAQARRDIQNSFEAYSIGLDHFGQPSPDYCSFVTKFFSALASKQLIRVEKVPVLYDTVQHNFPVEAFVSGCCPNCLEGTCGGICEGCGHPNSCTDLVGLDTNRYQTRPEDRLVFDLEQFRPALDDHLLRLGTHRPALSRLVTQLLSGRLKPFVLSYKTPRGIDTAALGLPGQHLNVWGEMYPGHMYWLTKAAGTAVSDAEYVQFLGFDNSYFYIIVHLALALAARQCGFDWPLPAAFVTNQFYYLGTRKFSTSKGHAVWARDLAAECNTDLARLFLALHGPEYQEASFSQSLFSQAADELAAKINKLAAAYNSTRSRHRSAQEVLPAEVVRLMSQEVSLKDYSNGDFARRAVHSIEYLDHWLSTNSEASTTSIPSALALCLEPLCPLYTAEIKRQFAIREHSWARPAQCPDHSLPEIQVQYANAAA